MRNIKRNSFRAWILASRPKTLTGAFIPVLLGSSLAFYDNSFSWGPALLCLLFAFLMQIASNLINDYIDFMKGGDNDDRLGPKRACNEGWLSPRAIQTGIWIIIFLAIMTGLGLVYIDNWRLIYIGIFCIMFAFFYSAGPYPLSYHGGGDISVLIFFGFVAVGGTYYVLSSSYSLSVAIISLISGLIIDSMLIINNFRDRTGDKESGKKTTIVIFGKKFGIYAYLFTGTFSVLLASSLFLYYAMIMKDSI